MRCPHCNKDIKNLEVGEFFECPHCEASLQLENQELILLKEGENRSFVREDLISSSDEQSLEVSNQNSMDEEFLNHPKSHSQAGEDSQIDSEHSSLLSETKTPLEKELKNNELLKQTHESVLKKEDPVYSEPIKNTENKNVHSLEDIVQFGNSLSQKNLFVYHLMISEVFSKEAYDRLQKILDSKTLKLDTSLLLSRFKNGKLSIQNLNAVKMVYLVRKLSSLPLKMHWTQESKL